MASVCLPCNLRYWLICFLNYNSCPRDGGIRKTLQPLCHPLMRSLCNFLSTLGQNLESRERSRHLIALWVWEVREGRGCELLCCDSIALRVFYLVRWGVRMLLPLSLGLSWIPFCGPGNYSGLSWTSWSWCLVFTLPVKSVSKRHSSVGRQGRKNVATH